MPTLTTMSTLTVLRRDVNQFASSFRWETTNIKSRKYREGRRASPSPNPNTRNPNPSDPPSRPPPMRRWQAAWHCDKRRDKQRPDVTWASWVSSVSRDVKAREWSQAWRKQQAVSRRISNQNKNAFKTRAHMQCAVCTHALDGLWLASCEHWT